MVDIHKLDEIRERLNRLKPDTPALFGKMTAQHMVEHLMFSVMFSNGKMPQQLFYPQEKAAVIKKALIYSNAEMPVGFKAPMLGEDLPELQFPDLETAVVGLFDELERFERYFAEDRNAAPINPTMGALNKDEWTVFHNKHFTHHFKQFGL